jgi:hypothetical protein
MSRTIFVGAIALGFTVLASMPWAWAVEPLPWDENQNEKPSPEAVARARENVQMLDNIYKTAVVLITDKYVNTEEDFPAGSAAIALFDAVGKAGHHQVKLLDVSGEPYNDDNVATDPFDKEGVRRLKSGDAYYDQVVVKDGKATLRAITPVPVVMQKCVMCHSNYADVDKGAPVGAISYTIPIK